MYSKHSGGVSVAKKTARGVGKLVRIDPGIVSMAKFITTAAWNRHRRLISRRSSDRPSVETTSGKPSGLRRKAGVMATDAPLPLDMTEPDVKA